MNFFLPDFLFAAFVSFSQSWGCDGFAFSVNKMYLEFRFLFVLFWQEKTKRKERPTMASGYEIFCLVAPVFFFRRTPNSVSCLVRNFMSWPASVTASISINPLVINCTTVVAAAFRHLDTAIRKYIRANRVSTANLCSNIFFICPSLFFLLTLSVSSFLLAAVKTKEKIGLRKDIARVILVRLETDQG